MMSMALAYLLDDETRLLPATLLLISILTTLYTLSSSHPSSFSCYSNKIIISIDVLLLPSCNLIQMMILRWYENSMEHINRLSHVVGAIFISFLSILISGIILFQSWSCSTRSLKSVYSLTILLSSYLSVVWIRSFLRTFIFTSDNQAKQSLLLLIRCSCLTRRFKKCLVVSPYFILSFYILASILFHWSANCVLPFQYFGLISSLTFLLMGIAALMLMSYGRRRIHLNESYEQLMDSIHGHDHTNRNHSSTASDSLVTLAKDSQRCLSLPVLWYFAGGIHLFGLVWGILGIYWSSYRDKCRHELIEVLDTSEVYLIIFSVFGMLIAWILKVESCFPAVLDPTHFHSNRTKNNQRPKRSGSCNSIDTIQLDESDSSLLHRTDQSGISNHQYGKGSLVKFSSHVDIEMNGRLPSSISKKPSGKDMKIGDSNPIPVGKDSKNSRYTRLPV